VVVRSFKAAATRRINELRGTARSQVWQRGYFERIVRDEDELRALRQYVVENPLRWALDRENPARARPLRLDE
jgi:hypothetical protein